MHFFRIFFGPFSIKFPILTLKTYHHRKEKSYRGSRDSLKTFEDSSGYWEDGLSPVVGDEGREEGQDEGEGWAGGN